MKEDKWESRTHNKTVSYKSTGHRTRKTLWWLLYNLDSQSCLQSGNHEGIYKGTSIWAHPRSFNLEFLEIKDGHWYVLKALQGMQSNARIEIPVMPLWFFYVDALVQIFSFFLHHPICLRSRKVIPFSMRGQIKQWWYKGVVYVGAMWEPGRQAYQNLIEDREAKKANVGWRSLHYFSPLTSLMARDLSQDSLSFLINMK
jgi:hypothetical protein